MSVVFPVPDGAETTNRSALLNVLDLFTDSLDLDLHLERVLAYRQVHCLRVDRVCLAVHLLHDEIEFLADRLRGVGEEFANLLDITLEPDDLLRDVRLLGQERNFLRNPRIVGDEPLSASARAGADLLETIRELARE